MSAGERGPYFDEKTKEWYRPRFEGARLLIAEGRDATPEQRVRAQECWACECETAHTRAFHDREMVKVWRRYSARRVDDDGTWRFLALDEPMPDDNSGE